MPNLIGNHAVVIGAGIGGLTAAKALSSFFERITVLERDELPAGPEPRVGTPQCRQVHLLLRGGMDALVEFFPNFESELKEAGAVRINFGSDIRAEGPGFDPFPRRDLGIDMLCMTRPLVEFILRRTVERQPQVSLQSGCRVTRLLISPNRDTVTGICYTAADGERRELLADFVIDASSRGALTLDLMDELGLVRPEETAIEIDMRYATGLFELPKEAVRDWRAVVHRPSASFGRGGFIFPIENGLWHVGFNGVHGDTPPDSHGEFLAFARTLRTSTIYDAIKDARPVGAIHKFALPRSVRRRFEKCRKFPRGLLPIADVICRFNPAFGQGMSVAAQEVGVLNQLLAARVREGRGIEGIAPEFFDAIQVVLATPWSVAENDFIYAKTRGERPKDFEKRLTVGLALLNAAAKDPAVHRLVAEVQHLKRPQGALREDPLIVSKVRRGLAMAVVTRLLARAGLSDLWDRAFARRRLATS
ncbi:2-polyprenyl-6-methoxyphenol hydroxylase-like FAD-dependent oxidoreductase [Bradyrhizobium sp. USDA 4341]